MLVEVSGGVCADCEEHAVGDRKLPAETADNVPAYCKAAEQQRHRQQIEIEELVRQQIDRQPDRGHDREEGRQLIGHRPDFGCASAAGKPAVAQCAGLGKIKIAHGDPPLRLRPVRTGRMA